MTEQPDTSAGITFAEVKYDRPGSLDYDVMPGMSELPDITVKIADSTYFADSSGFLMVWTGRRTWCEESKEYWIVPENAAWSDETFFEGKVPNEVKVAHDTVANALTVLHRIDRDAADNAYTDFAR